MQTHIYNSNLEKVVSLNYKLEMFKQEPKRFYPMWEESMTATETLYRHPVLVDGSLREKTRIELVEEGIETLHEGEVIRFKTSLLEEEFGSNVEEKEIVFVPKPTNMLKPVWESPEWVESATEEELSEFEFDKAVKFYNFELEFAAKATAELNCGIITVEMFNDVKLYMQSIEPYNIATPLIERTIVTRPPIFDRYK